MRFVIDKVALGQVFPQELKVLSVTNIIPLVLHSSSSSYYCLQKDKQAKPGYFQRKQCSSRYWGAQDRNVPSPSVLKDPTCWDKAQKGTLNCKISMYILL
jgi:hypothetical protein